MLPEATTAVTAATTYDRLAPRYDARYSSEQHHAENAWVRDLAVSALGPPSSLTLDLGAGTGLALDIGAAQVSAYVAVDPSVSMLVELTRKHPLASCFCGTALGFMRAAADNGFTAPRVLALFGAASYIGPAPVQAVTGLLSPLGAALLMFYAPGYLPDYHEDDPALMDLSAASRAAALDLGDVIEWGNYTVVVVRNGG